MLKIAILPNKVQLFGYVVMTFTNIDSSEFGGLLENHRRELQVHCYRLMGSTQDAEDMVQEAFLRAWRRRDTLEDRAALRAWLYRIATNVCLDALKRRPQRFVPITRESASSIDEPIPPEVVEPIWLEPYPDEWLIVDTSNPEALLSSRENIELAFIAALHVLPPRQRAIFILREVLDWQASEVAALLDTSVSAVKSALHRARAALADHEPVPAHNLDAITQTHLENYVRAWEAADVNALMSLLTEDATFSMPPIPSWYRGRVTIGRLTGMTIFRGQGQGRWRLLPTRANRQPAFGLYRQGESPNVHHFYGIQVLTYAGDLLTDITTFRNPALVQFFNLPAVLPA